MAKGDSKNVMLAKGISKFSRSAMAKKKGSFKKAGKSTPKTAASAVLTKSKKINGDKNGGTRDVAVVKAPRFYPTEDVTISKKKKKVAVAKKIRASITPGTVLILLSGRFSGKRVVCLGTLPSGLLIVSGPFNLNGVPVKRVNQAFVIATSTKVDVAGIDISAFTDSYFARPAKKTNKGSGDFFEKQDQEAKVIDPARIAAQKAVDTKLCAAIGKVDMLRDYMRSTFTLRKGQFPHQMKFCLTGPGTPRATVASCLSRARSQFHAPDR
jgi:large subunit ribosomal protein L6e